MTHTHTHTLQNNDDNNDDDERNSIYIKFNTLSLEILWKSLDKFTYFHQKEVT